ncbi:MAG TPA: hypothetical protein VK581_11840 [Chthoniobacterales bacterium]|nr:hypothetical protein [Chthoniobacterales bacterium]
MVKYICAQIAGLAFAALAFAAEPTAAPDLSDARVTLPYAELKTLWQAAQRETPEKRKPPIEATLLAARYQLTLKGDQATGVVDYETQSFTDEWTIIPLLGAQTQIDEVEPADVQLITREGRYALITNRAGKLKLRIKFAVKLSSATDGAHFRLAISPGSINTLAVAGIPEKQTIRISDATQLSAEKDRASFRLPAQEELAFDVIPEKALVPPTPSRWKIEAQALVQFGDGKLNYTARLAANTDQGSGLTMELEFPAGADITRIAGPDLGDWQATTSENQSRRVHLRWQTRDVLRRELEVEYNFAQPLTSGEWNLKSPRLIEGENNPPLYVVVPEPGLELTVATPSAVPRQLPPWLLEKADGKSYLIFLGDAPLTAKWLPLVETAQAVVETATAKTRIVSDGALLTEIHYTVRHERALRWSVDLPEGCELLASSIEGHAVKPIDRGAHVLEFSLPSGKAVTAVSLSYTARKPAFKPVSGQIAVELPQTDLLVHWIDWELRIPVAYEIAAFEGNVESAPCDKTDSTSRVIQLHKELCQKERPRAEFFYQKPQPNK